MVGPSRRVVIATLGVTQIFAWGSSYYLPAVLAPPIATDMSWPLSLVVSGLSLGLLAAGVVSPHVGVLIERHGGRPVLAASSVLLAAGLVLLGTAHTLTAYLLAWLVVGLGMGAGLYDAAFATLGRAYGDSGRRAITALTLWAGFSSTVCWPLSAALVEPLGWRGTCFAYAALQLALSLPAHLLLVPRVLSASPEPAAAPTVPPVRPARSSGLAFLLLAGVVTIGGAVSAVVSVHLLTLLQARGLDVATAVALGVLVGPSQVGARLVEMVFGRRYHPIWSLLGGLLLVAGGLGLLALGVLAALAVGLMLYGAGNGVYSIARGTVPLALFGSSGYATLMGRLALPSLMAQAVAPWLGAFVLEHGGAGWTVGVLAGLGAVNAALAIALARACQAPETGPQKP